MEMAAVGLVIKLFGLVFKILIVILGKLRLLPAFLFLLITQIWFPTLSSNIGWWYEAIVIGLCVLGLGSFAVQGIIKLRRHVISSKYESELEAENEQAILDELYRSGRITRIKTPADDYRSV